MSILLAVLPPWNLWPELLKAATPLAEFALSFILVSAVLFVPCRDNTVHGVLRALVFRVKKGKFKMPGVEGSVETYEVPEFTKPPTRQLESPRGTALKTLTGLRLLKSGKTKKTDSTEAE